MLADKFNLKEQARVAQRDNHMAYRRNVMRKEADEMNVATMQVHAFQKDYGSKVKQRDGRFSNSYAPETLRLAAFGGQIAANDLTLGGMNANISAGKQSMANAAMKTITGVTKVSPERVTTLRQIRHYEDNQKRIDEDRQRKASLRADLERQMQAKVFKREKDRLHMDEKDLVTSKGILKQIGHVVPSRRHDEDITDLKLLEKDERFTTDQVKTLQNIAYQM